MSYVGHKSLAFRDAGDIPLVVRRRSEGRIKTYPSATDARAWCDIDEDRRQHLLDLIRANHEKCALGKYVPFEVLIDTLLANKNAELQELQQLLHMYSKLNLTEDQKRMLEGMKRERDRAKAAGDQAGVPGISGISGVSGVPGIPGVSGGSGVSGVSGGPGRKTVGTEDRPIFKDSDTSASTEVGGPGSTASKRTESGSVGIDDGVTSPGLSKSVTSGKAEAPSGTVGIKPMDMAAARSALDKYGINELKDLVIQKDAELIALKNELAAKQAEIDQQSKIARKAIEQLETLQDIMEERDVLRKKLEESFHELQSLRNRVEDPCVAEIAKLEEEIERLRVNGPLTPEAEAEVIRKEVDVLKKYCAKLSKIQEENGKLKSQIEKLQELSGIPNNYKDVPEDTNNPDELKNRLRDLRRKLAKLDEIIDERDKLKQRVKQLEEELLKYGSLPEEVETFRRKSQLLDDVLDERANLQERLKNVQGMEEELIQLKKKAARVDELEALLNGERRSSAAEIDALKSANSAASKTAHCIKTECDMLKQQAAQAANLEAELERLRYKAKEAELLKIERDRLKVRLDELACIEAEFMVLLDKTKCLEAVKAERDMYKAKYEQLLGLECECDTLRAQVERYKQLDKEREALLRQVRDCECCIADQEDEIKKLVGHVDRLSKGTNQQQERMQRALSDMRAELEQKSCVMAMSEEKLAGVQDRLKSTIAEVSCETSCLRAYIDELRGKLKDRDQEIDYLNSLLADKDEIINTLGKGMDGDEHYEKMLTQSKTAVRRAAEELGKHYEECRGVQVPVTQAGTLATIPQVDTHTSTPKVPVASTVTEPVKAPLSSDEASAAKVDTADAEADIASTQITHATDAPVTSTVDAQVTPFIDDQEKASADTQANIPDRVQEKLSTDTQANIPDRVEEKVSTDTQARLPAGAAEKPADTQTVAKAGEFSGDNEELLNKIKQLQEQLAKSNEAIAKCKDELSQSERLQAENQALRKHSAEAQDVAKDQTQDLLEQLKKAKERIAELEAQLAAASTQAGTSADDAMKQKMLDLEEQLKKEVNLRKETGDQDKVNQELQNKNSALADENSKLLQQLADLKKQLEDQKSATGDTAELMALRQERDALRTQVTQVTEQQKAGGISGADLEKERKEKEDLQNLIKSLQGQISTMEKSGAAAPPAPPTPPPAADSSLADALAKLTAQLEAAEAKNKELEKQNSELKTLSTGDNKEMEKLKAQLKDLEKQNDQLSKATPGENTALLQQLDDLKKKNKDLEEKKVDGPSPELKNCKDELDKLKAQIKDLEKQNDQLSKAAAGDNKDLLKQLDDLKKKNKELEDKGKPGVDAKTSAKDVVPATELKSCKDELDKLKMQIKDLEKQNNQLSKAASGDNSALIKQLEDLKKKNKDLEDKNNTLEKQKPDTKDGTSSTELKNCKEELEKLKAQIKDLENQNNQLSKAAAGDNQELIDQLNEFKKKAKDLEAKNTVLEKEKGTPSKGESSAEMKNCKDELERLKAKIQELEKENDQLLKAAAGDDSHLLDELNDLKQKIKDLEGENGNLRNKVQSKDMGEQSENDDQLAALKAELERQKKECSDTIASLKAQYDRDNKNLRNKYNDGIAKLQGSHEEILKDIGKEHESEVENLRSELRSSKAQLETLEKRTRSIDAGKPSSLSQNTVENVNIKPDEFGLCTCGPTFQRILQKILKSGIESLSYDELRFLHNKTCQATAKVLAKGTAPMAKASMPQVTRDSAAHIKSDKLVLMRRIGLLENDLMRKQKHAQQKVGALQIAIKMERQRLQELKELLETEKLRNSELMVKIGAQSRVVANIEAEKDVMQKQSSFHEEKLHELLMSCDEKKLRVKRLEEELERAKTQQQKDAELLKHMRSQLEKTVQNEMQMKPTSEKSPSGEQGQEGCPCISGRPRSASSTARVDDSAKSVYYTVHPIQETQKKRHSINKCCLKHREEVELKKRSCSSPRCPRKASRMDDVD